MGITLGTNASSLQITNKLNSTSNDLTSIMQKLSSGLKINTAKDDAAGLVISENMKAKIQSSTQAMANIQTANGFLTIAEDGMVSISDHMQRINDLLTNMANDTNDISSRNASVSEIIERLDEINRLAKTTQFNGKNMLDGSAKEIIVQLGSDSTIDSTLDISSALTDCHTSALGIRMPAALYPNLYENGGKYYLKEKDENGKDVYYEASVENQGGKLVITEYDEDGFIKTKDTPATLQGDITLAFNANNENCREYMGIIQDAIGSLASRRGLLGAFENRMESSYDSLTIRVESLESAKGVYTDTDVAKEATNYTNKQILEQLNVSLLASANSNQQLALSLLG